MLRKFGSFLLYFTAGYILGCIVTAIIEEALF